MLSSITKTVHINDQPVAFHRLTLEDLFSICDGIIAEREALAKEIAANEKLQKFEVANLVLQVRSVKPTVEDVYNGCSTPQGAANILHKSLAKAGVSDKAERSKTIGQLKIGDGVELARMLVLDEQEEEKVEEKKEEVKTEAKEEEFSPKVFTPAQ